MIQVLLPARIEPNPQYGWQFYLQMGEAFDKTIPFRDRLEDIRMLLSRSAPATLELPPYEAGEDFVEGSLRWGEAVIGVYYEYSLGYLVLLSAERAKLEDAVAQLRPELTVR